MFLRHTKRKKDGKEHRYWSIVENRRIGGGRVVQRPLLYLGEINDSQELAWRKSIAILEEGALQPRTRSLFPEDRCAMADLLGDDLGLAGIHKLYRCHDRLLEHKQALFDHLVGRWRDLFNISFDVLLYDLTSTYFEADPPFAESDKRRHGYSRDH